MCHTSGAVTKADILFLFLVKPAATIVGLLGKDAAVSRLVLPHSNSTFPCLVGLNEWKDMDDVITLSSDSDEDDCDVEIVGSYNVKTPDDPTLLSAVKIDVSGVNVKVPTVR